MAANKTSSSPKETPSWFPPEPTWCASAEALVYTPGMTAGDYVARSGGFTDRADDDKVIILHASAEVTIGDEDSNIAPGDELLVAPRVDGKLLQNASDITQVLYQIAVAAAVVIAL